ncbi:MAG: very short patch repair endonuclease [Candidatus Binataceae bacterium]
MDTVSPTRRSEIMSLVRGKDTRPELAVRRLVYAMGHRYRLHPRKIPGAPDLAFAGRHKVIFVHGCFWHRHPGCPNTRTPKSNVSFWQTKLADNRRRDLRNQRRLAALGWSFLVIWECELSDMIKVRRRLKAFLVKKGEKRWSR